MEEAGYRLFGFDDVNPPDYAETGAQAQPEGDDYAADAPPVGAERGVGEMVVRSVFEGSEIGSDGESDASGAGIGFELFDERSGVGTQVQENESPARIARAERFAQMWDENRAGAEVGNEDAPQANAQGGDVNININIRGGSERDQEVAAMAVQEALGALSGHLRALPMDGG